MSQRGVADVVRRMQEFTCGGARTHRGGIRQAVERGRQQQRSQNPNCARDRFHLIGVHLAYGTASWPLGISGWHPTDARRQP